jgi:hypothetical protein
MPGRRRRVKGNFLCAIPPSGAAVQCTDAIALTLIIGTQELME